MFKLEILCLELNLKSLIVFHKTIVLVGTLNMLGLAKRGSVRFLQTK